MSESLLDRIATTPVLPPPEVRVQLREALGIRQVDLAAEIGVSTQTIYAWEHGRAEPRGQRRTTYAKLLDAMRQRVEEAA